MFDNASNLHSNLTTNGTTTSLMLKNLTTGLHYKVKAAAFTQVGIGPSTPLVTVFIDPHRSAGIDGLSRRSSSLHTIVQQPWFIAVLGSLLFLLLSVFLVAVFFRRRLAWKKALGVQINVPLHKTEGMRGMNSCETLWINQTLNSSHASNANSINESKLMDKPDPSMEHNYYSVCAPDYAEVDTHSMATYYKRELNCSLAPYATTTLINTPKNPPGSVYDSKSSSSEFSKKSEKCHDPNTRLPNDDVFEHFMNKSQPCSSVNYSNVEDYAYQGRQLKNKFMPGTSKNLILNWTDLPPPPPENPPTELNTSNYQAQSYQGNFTTKPLNPTSPWSTLGRPVDNETGGLFVNIKGTPPSGLMPQRTLPPPQSGATVFQGSLTSVRSDQFPGISRRISQNGMITAAGFPFPFFLTSSSSGGDVHQIYTGISLQEPIVHNQDGEDIELNNLYSNHSTATDESSGRNVPTSEDNQNIQPCTNEYSNNYFIAEYNAGRAQTTLRNRCSRPPSSYSNDGNTTGTVPARNCLTSKPKWKDAEKEESLQNDDIPSYNKPTFPSVGGGGSRRRARDKEPNELSPLNNFAALAERYGGDATADTAPQEVSEEKDR